MGQNRLENQIKEKLNQREIQPSVQAWDRLDAMLTVAEEKKTKRSFGWLYIAASVLVFATLGLFFFNQNGNETQPQNSVVDTEVKKEDKEQESIIENNAKSVAVENVPSNESHQSVIENQSNTNQSVSIKDQSNENQKSTPNPLINRNKEIEFQNSSDVALKDLPKVMDSKSIFIQPRSNSSDNVQSDEQLLAGLDNVAKQSTDKKAALKVDARNLLSQVDGELEMTFREKMISKVKKNYKEVKVALANRNQE